MTIHGLDLDRLCHERIETSRTNTAAKYRQVDKARCPAFTTYGYSLRAAPEPQH
ncbi:hypothetical protein GQ607_012209 [Colletotrichum asianum]|uniref:Uncharacterized protein n=1 Tax=Colletotrichum asianum TaxID=702518 RepID=A0A8H3W9K0_9PEZI|nr:hypothetical protein GQ607_012209 [Colletotrichum asianum]